MTTRIKIKAFFNFKPKLKEFLSKLKKVFFITWHCLIVTSVVYMHPI